MLRRARGQDIASIHWQHLHRLSVPDESGREVIPLGMVRAARMRERKRGPGRPSFGVKETSVQFWAPDELVEAMRARAEREAIPLAEAWRRAAREWLGLKPDAYSKSLDEKESGS